MMGDDMVQTVDSFYCIKCKRLLVASFAAHLFYSGYIRMNGQDQQLGICDKHNYPESEETLDPYQEVCLENQV